MFTLTYVALVTMFALVALASIVWAAFEHRRSVDMSVRLFNSAQAQVHAQWANRSTRTDELDYANRLARLEATLYGKNQRVRTSHALAHLPKGADVPVELDAVALDLDF